MMNFCTLFDSYYLHKGIALYLSLEHVTCDFHLYVMAFDKESYGKLTALGFKHMTVELVDDFESPELLAVKPSRSKGEYCWTCGPSVIYHFLTKNNLDEITYLDADLFFLTDPKTIFEEIGSSSVAITEQGIDEKTANTYGRYCVQYMTFRKDQEGIEALTWWRDRCIKWCYARIEDNRFGDQKYLDEFPKRWKNIYVVKNLGVGIAPWNMHRYQYTDDHLSFRGITYPFVFFHMHGVQVDVESTKLTLKSKDAQLSEACVRLFYQPYAELLKHVLNTYMGYHIDSIDIQDMSQLKVWEYKLRSMVRNNKMVRWLYYSLLKKSSKGHGTKL